MRVRGGSPEGDNSVNQVDAGAKKIYVDRSRGLIKAAPLVLPEAYDDPANRATVASYYEATYHARLNQ